MRREYNTIKVRGLKVGHVGKGLHTACNSKCEGQLTFPSCPPVARYFPSGANFKAHMAPV